MTTTTDIPIQRQFTPLSWHDLEKPIRELWPNMVLTEPQQRQWFKDLSPFDAATIGRAASAAYADGEDRRTTPRVSVIRTYCRRVAGGHAGGAMQNQVGESFREQADACDRERTERTEFRAIHEGDAGFWAAWKARYIEHLESSHRGHDQDMALRLRKDTTSDPSKNRMIVDFAIRMTRDGRGLES